MARFRTLDPAMRDSPQLDELSLLALLLLDRLIQEADDEGRQYGDPRSIWRAAFLRDNAPNSVTRESAVAAVDELVRRGIVVRYEVAGQSHIALPGWKDGDSWQNQNVSRMKPSRFPAPPKGSVKVNPRGRGAPPADRSDAPVTDDAAPRHGVVAGDADVDADVDATRRGADADTDAKRASPSPSPAGAGSGEVRPGDGDGARANTAERRGLASVKAVLDGMAVKKVPRLSGSELAERLRAERVHHCGDAHAQAIDDALTMRSACQSDLLSKVRKLKGCEETIRAPADGPILFAEAVADRRTDPSRRSESEAGEVSSQPFRPPPDRRRRCGSSPAGRGGGRA